MTSEERLKEYVELDYVYQEWKRDENINELSDFDWFCVQHCQDIEHILNENEELKKKLKELLWKEKYKTEKESYICKLKY